MISQQSSAASHLQNIIKTCDISCTDKKKYECDGDTFILQFVLGGAETKNIVGRGNININVSPSNMARVEFPPSTIYRP